MAAPPPADPPDLAGIEALAADETQEGRVRYLAWSRLREVGGAVRPKVLLGVVVELWVDGGLDTLAA